jgi:hypothetical protein
MYMISPPAEGHVVKDYMDGRVHVRICDDYCRNKTPEEIQEILDRCSEIWSNAEAAKAARQAEQKNVGTDEECNISQSSTAI